MTTPTPQDASEENGASRKEALNRLSNPAMQAALNAICALIEDGRSPESSGEPPAPKQTGLTLETAKEICSKLLGVPYSPPGSVTVSGYIVTTEDHQFALDPDGKNDFIAVHGSKDAAQNEVSWLMEAQSNNGKDIPEIRPVRLEVRQAAHVVTDVASAMVDQEATTDATPEPDYVQPWWDLEFQRQIEYLADKFPGAQAHNGTSKHAPIPAQLDGTESPELVERLVQDVVSSDSPQRRNRLRGRRAAFVERLMLVLAVLGAAGLGYWIAYLAHVDAAYAHGRAEAAIDLRHIAELNASESGRIAEAERANASEEARLRLQAEQLVQRQKAHFQKIGGLVRKYIDRGHEELTGVRQQAIDEAPGEQFLTLRLAGEIFRDSGIEDEELREHYDNVRADLIRQLTEFLYPDASVNETLNSIALGTKDTDE